MKISTKTGAASFFIVALSTLLLSVVVLSASAVVVSEVIRTSNDDLSQSAYDSALAGVEDAKAAIANYRSCVEKGITVDVEHFTVTNDEGLTCEEIIYFMEKKDENGEKNCNMVARMLGRIGKNKDEEIIISEGQNGENNLEQAYTCVKINTDLHDYMGTLSSTTASRAIKFDLTDEEAASINSMRISWYSDSNANGQKYNYGNYSGGSVIFPTIKGELIATPPTISVQLLQTTKKFKTEDFDISQGDKTDRGMLFLVPFGNESGTSDSNENNFRPAYKSDINDNRIGADAFVKSNDKTSMNKPYTVFCSDANDSSFACSTSIALPKPVPRDIGHEHYEERIAGTFMLIISLPYGAPDTDFSIELCKDVNNCSTSYGATTGTESADEKPISLHDTQVEVDSTGRANDLYRRVETRLETTNTLFSYSDYALQLLNTKDGGTGSGPDDSEGNKLDKTLYTTCEYDFNPTCRR